MFFFCSGTEGGENDQGFNTQKEEKGHQNTDFFFLLFLFWGGGGNLELILANANRIRIK